MTVNNKITRIGVGTFTLDLQSSPLDFAGQVTAGTIKPSVKSDDPIKFLNGDTTSGNTEYTYKIEMTTVHNLTSKGLMGFLWENRGKSAKLTYVPNSDDGFKIVCDVRLDPPETGGEVGSKDLVNVSFDVLGEPQITLAIKAGGLAP